MFTSEQATGESYPVAKTKRPRHRRSCSREAEVARLANTISSLGLRSALYAIESRNDMSYRHDPHQRVFDLVECAKAKNPVTEWERRAPERKAWEAAKWELVGINWDRQRDPLLFADACLAATIAPADRRLCTQIVRAARREAARLEAVRLQVLAARRAARSAERAKAKWFDRKFTDAQCSSEGYHDRRQRSWALHRELSTDRRIPKWLLG
jgi:hypothetical protein